MIEIPQYLPDLSKVVFVDNKLHIKIVGPQIFRECSIKAYKDMKYHCSFRNDYKSGNPYIITYIPEGTVARISKSNQIVAQLLNSTSKHEKKKLSQKLHKTSANIKIKTDCQPVDITSSDTEDGYPKAVKNKIRELKIAKIKKHPYKIHVKNVRAACADLASRIHKISKSNRSLRQVCSFHEPLQHRMLNVYGRMCTLHRHAHKPVILTNPFNPFRYLDYKFIFNKKPYGFRVSFRFADPKIDPFDIEYIKSKRSVRRKRNN